MNKYRKYKKDSQRLKEINNVWHLNEPMECVDINAKHLQDLYDFIRYLCEEIIKLERKNNERKETN